MAAASTQNAGMWKSWKISANKQKYKILLTSNSDRQNIQKRVAEKQDVWKIAIFLVLIVILGTLVFKKPSVTGRVIQSGEAVFSENLNLQLNESGSYEWQVKNPGSIKSLKMSGSVSSNGSARVYIEKNGTRQLIFDSSKQLFDADIHVLPEYKKIFQGGEILIQIALINLRGFGKGDIGVDYSIKDSKGNLIATEKESVYVETQAKFIRKLVMPAEIKPGTYSAFVEASSNATIVGTGSDTFEVTARYEYKPELRYYLIGLAVLAGAIILFILLMHRHGEIRKKKKIAELRAKKPLEKIEKLEKELMALEEAHSSKFISEESYRKEKARIENELRKAKK